MKGHFTQVWRTATRSGLCLAVVLQFCFSPVLFSQTKSQASEAVQKEKESIYPDWITITVFPRDGGFCSMGINYLTGERARINDCRILTNLKFSADLPATGCIEDTRDGWKVGYSKDAYDFELFQAWWVIDGATAQALKARLGKPDTGLDYTQEPFLKYRFVLEERERRFLNLLYAGYKRGTLRITGSAPAPPPVWRKEPKHWQILRLPASYAKQARGK